MGVVDYCLLPFFAEIAFADLNEASGVFVATTNVNIVLLGQLDRTGLFVKSRLSFLRLPEASGPCAVTELTGPQDICSILIADNRGVVSTIRLALPRIESL
jgi:hypothetical protein